MFLSSQKAPLTLAGCALSILTLLSSIMILISLVRYQSSALEHFGTGLLWTAASVNLLASITIVIILFFGIRQPLLEIIKRLSQVIEGDHELVFPELKRRDEFGLLTDQIIDLKDSLLKVERLSDERQIVARWADQQNIEHVRVLTERFQGKIDQMVAGFLTASRDLENRATEMAVTADTARDKVRDVSTNSQSASENVSSVSKAAEVLSRTFEDITERSEASTHIAAAAEEEVSRTNDTIQGLSEASQKIGEVVQLINQIANQTNLLALNATIEAARAGDAGRGFAVVAGEVKNLAQQTATATDDISLQVATIQQEITATVSAIGRIGKTISEMSGIAHMVSDAMKAQIQEAQHINQNALKASESAHVVSDSITDVEHSANQTGNVAVEVLENSSTLSQHAQDLLTEVNGFLSSLRMG